MKVPFVDLQAQYRGLGDEILPAIESVMERAAFILGQEVSDFERDFARFCGRRECVGVASGCDALLWALKACGIGPGDEVITVANTYIATALAISFAGAKPVLVDCREDTYEIDSDAVLRAVTSATKAILPVHLYGHPADMDPILDVALRHGLKVIEDTAQAHGAAYHGRPCGAMGDAGCFSFYPGKNLGAYGDGGAVATDDPHIAEMVRMYRNYGQPKKYYHDLIGWNSRLDTIQAAVLNVKLKHLESWNEARHRHANQYCELLKDLPVVLPVERPGCRHVYHLFVIRCKDRDGLVDFMAKKGVSCVIHYPVPIHLQKAYADLGYGEGSFPVTERIAKEIVSLPMYPELTDEQIRYVCEGVGEFLGR